MFIIKADGLAMSNAQYFSLMFEDPWHSRCYFYFLWPYVTTWRTLPIVKLFCYQTRVPISIVQRVWLWSPTGPNINIALAFVFKKSWFFQLITPHHFEVKKCMLKFHILNEYRNRTCITYFFRGVKVP